MSNANFKITGYAYASSDRLAMINFEDENSDMSGYIMLKNPSPEVISDIMQAYDSRYPRSLVNFHLKGNSGSSDRY